MNKIRHLNCGSLHARFPRASAILYCLLVETNHGLILVDTGFGSQDYANPSPLMRLFLMWMGVPGNMEETAAFQIKALGYDLEDVRHIVLTHLHLDHAGGLRDFPNARVHLSQTEHEAGMNPRGLLERAYDARHWSHGPDWVIHGGEEKDWFGYRSFSIIEGLKPEVRLVPLPGHTRGHCGVAIEGEGGWLFQCGDAASPLHPATDLHGREENEYRAAVLPDWFVYRVIGPHVPGLRQLLDRHGEEIEMISSHDLYSFQRHTREGI